MGVTVGREHLEHTATELEDRDIEGTATEVEHGNLHVLVGLVDTVGERSSCRLVHDTLHLQAGNLTSLLGCLTLRVREVGGHGDNGLCHLLAEVVLSGLFHLLQDHSRNLLGSILVAVDVHEREVVVATHYGVGYA